MGIFLPFIRQAFLALRYIGTRPFDSKSFHWSLTFFAPLLLVLGGKSRAIPQPVKHPTKWGSPLPSLNDDSCSLYHAKIQPKLVSALEFARSAARSIAGLTLRRLNEDALEDG